MNNRIKELIKASGGIGHDDDGQELPPMLVGSGLEMFAELIVRECLHQCYWRGMNDALYEGQLKAAYYIEDHFGIEL